MRRTVTGRHECAKEIGLERGIGLRIPGRVLEPDDRSEVVVVADLPVRGVRAEERKVDPASRAPRSCRACPSTSTRCGRPRRRRDGRRATRDRGRCRRPPGTRRRNRSVREIAQAASRGTPAAARGAGRRPIEGDLRGATTARAVELVEAAAPPAVVCLPGRRPGRGLRPAGARRLANDEPRRRHLSPHRVRSRAGSARSSNRRPSPQGSRGAGRQARLRGRALRGSGCESQGAPASAPSHDGKHATRLAPIPP